MVEFEKSVQQSYPRRKITLAAWIRKTIATDSARLAGEVAKDGGMSITDEKIAMGNQNKIGENIPARKW